jgi:hypothetical protein
MAMSPRPKAVPLDSLQPTASRNTSGCDTAGAGGPGSRDSRAPPELCRRLDSVVEHGLHDAVHPAVEAVIDAGRVLQ